MRSQGVTSLLDGIRHRAGRHLDGARRRHCRGRLCGAADQLGGGHNRRGDNRHGFKPLHCERPCLSAVGDKRMAKKKSDDGDRISFRTLVSLALIAFAIALAVGVYTRLSDVARAVVTGVFCTAGVAVTIVMLIVLIRQSNGGA